MPVALFQSMPFRLKRKCSSKDEEEGEAFSDMPIRVKTLFNGDIYRVHN